MSELNLNSLYQQLILEHYRKPRNKGELPEATVEIHMANPVCGDEIRLQLQIDGDRIVEARHVGQGCSISQAAVSMMTHLLKEKSLSEAEGLAVSPHALRFAEHLTSADGYDRPRVPAPERRHSFQLLHDVESQLRDSYLGVDVQGRG